MEDSDDDEEDTTEKENEEEDEDSMEDAFTQLAMRQSEYDVYIIGNFWSNFFVIFVKKIDF